MSARRPWLRKAAMLLASCASAGVAASAVRADAPAWTADPDEQFFLDVDIRQLRLGEGVRAYKTPEGTCVILSDFVTALDVPIHIDPAAKKASGWAFKESDRISVDYGVMRASYGAKSETIAPGTIRETPEGWCVQTSALSRWFGIGVRPVTSGSTLLLQSDEKLPVELAMERQMRAQRLKPARFDLSLLPQVPIPYRMWRAPAVDFVVSTGVTRRPNDGIRFDSESSVYAAGEIARQSYDAQFATTGKGTPAWLRLRAYRSDPDGQLLGPAKATHFGYGDVEGFDSRLTGTAARGRGAVLTNRPLTTQTAFDRSHFEGDLPTGWEAEIYRNDELLGFAKAGSDQRYVFDDVQLLYGENRIRIVLYGPQGQIRTREELINVGVDNVPPGKSWYWAGFNQPGRDIFTLHRLPDGTDLPQAQATLSLEHGIDDRMSVGALTRMMLIGGRRVSFLEAMVRRSIGLAMFELGGARESTGGTAARAQVLGKIGPVNVSGEALAAHHFNLQGGRIEDLHDYRLSLDAPLKLGRAVLPAHADARWSQRGDGSTQLDSVARLSANLERFNLSTAMHYRKQFLASGIQAPGELSLEFMGTGRVRDVRLRGTTEFDMSPAAKLRSAELSAYWSASEHVDWEGDLVYDANARQGRARISHIERLDRFALALTGEAATNGALAFGINLNFSLDPRGGFTLSRLPLASAGSVHATVYRDLNGNGVRDPSEPVEKGALVTTGTKQADFPTNGRGSVMIAGLTPFTPMTVGVDESSLSDPMLVPKKALQVVIPRPGVPAEVEIGLVGGGDIEGAIVKDGGRGFEGLDLELLDPSGRVVSTTRTDFDGFFLFERVAYGHYSIRVAAASAEAARISPELGASLDISPDKAVVRLGAIRVRRNAVIASAGASRATK
jgi:hypothetical protein